MQEIKVSCDTKLRIPLDELNAIQGNLKSMTPENKIKLRKLILRFGINFNLSVWKESFGLSGEQVIKFWLIDGHGRVEELRAMRADGFTIPDIPCVEIEADDLNDAKERVLASSSSFQRINPDGLYDFLQAIEMPVESLRQYDLVTVDVDKFRTQYYENNNPSCSAVGSKELDRNSFTEFKQSCPKCGFSFDDNKKSDD